MSLEDNKVLVQRFIDEVMNAGNTGAIADFCVAGSMFAGGIEGQIKAMKMSFPDNHLTIDDILAEGNKVAVRVTTHGTNTGPLVGLPAFGRLETPVPPTGKSVTGSGTYVFTVSDGKIVSFAAELDQIGLLRQLGWTFTPPGTTQIPTDSFKTELFDLLTETFEQVQGIYLDRGTSFFETLDTISAEEASRPVSAKCASIAAQVEHVRFYLRVLEAVIQKKTIGKIDWEESWQLAEVTPEGWEALKQELRETYQSVLTVMNNLDVWEGEDDVGASLAILAHTAYHLGEIRQALCVVK